MEGLLALAQRHQLYVVEDAAQALGSHYRFSDGREAMAGTMGHLGCTSFFPSKNLGCAGDGGAVFTNDDALAHVVRQLANHGMGRQYEYERAGINSRLDTLQAAILRVKLPRLDAFNQRRRQAAEAYDRGLAEIKGVTRPFRCAKSRHIFHQYTLRVAPQLRDGLQAQLDQAQIPNKVYYPTPLQAHACYADARSGPMTETERACQSVLSLPMHSELDEAQIAHIVEAVAAYYATAPAASH
jgi:dTDP-4-amino-4,6-dideoxygalactose transaminase